MCDVHGEIVAVRSSRVTSLRCGEGPAIGRPAAPPAGAGRSREPEDRPPLPGVHERRVDPCLAHRDATVTRCPGGHRSRQPGFSRSVAGRRETAVRQRIGPLRAVSSGRESGRARQRGKPVGPAQVARRAVPVCNHGRRTWRTTSTQHALRRARRYGGCGPSPPSSCGTRGRDRALAPRRRSAAGPADVRAGRPTRARRW